MSVEYDAAMEVKSAIDSLRDAIEFLQENLDRDMPSIRDRFAEAALQALINRYPSTSLGAGVEASVPAPRETVIAGICTTAYIYADAMMKARLDGDSI